MSADTLTMRDAVKACDSPLVAPRAALPTLTDVAIADAAHYAYTQGLGVVPEADGLDLDTVEHGRQSRLQRWQRLP